MGHKNIFYRKNKKKNFNFFIFFYITKKKKRIRKTILFNFWGKGVVK